MERAVEDMGGEEHDAYFREVLLSKKARVARVAGTTDEVSKLERARIESESAVTTVCFG